MKAGLVGLGVMGRNLALNLLDKGHQVVATDSWESARSWSAPGIAIADTHAALCDSLDGPRILLLMVKAGEQVDKEIANLLPHLSAGDIILDGGNSNYHDTERRADALAARQIGYLGVGVSGGAEGARRGPAMMVGGAQQDWDRAKDLLAPIAATIEYFGAGGAGHFVKMVHNGIEYAIMEAIAECHGLMRDAAGQDHEVIAAAFERWSSQGAGAGFLLEITAEICRTRDTLTGDLLLPYIDDAAGQKGTGGWTVQACLDYGVPAPAIMEAVAMRQISGAKDIRGPLEGSTGDALRDVAKPAHAERLSDDLEAALAATMIASLAQGLHIYSTAAEARGWSKDLASVLRVWRAGSILRMGMLEEIARPLAANATVRHILALPEITSRLAGYAPGWRRSVAFAANAGYPAPVLSTSLAYVDALVTRPLPTALVQAQRDRFGAHGFRRTDREGDFHGPWVYPDEEAGA
jgi:6-phosphogluconate dehydrogenase